MLTQIRPVTATFRFAPSPNGRLHLGHAFSALLNAALAARLGGRCLLRIEDIDPERSRPDLIAAIHDDLAWLDLLFDGPVRRQSEHLPFYRSHLEELARQRLAYPCFCSRGQIAARVRGIEASGRALPRDPDGTPCYLGTCRALPSDEASRRRKAGEPHSWRLDMARALAVAPGPHVIRCFERRGQGGFLPHFAGGAGTWEKSASSDATVSSECKEILADPSVWGDAVLGRRDVKASYHLCVVLDDALQGVSHVVRGQDLREATSLHVLLQALLGLPSPSYHHHGLLADEAGAKLAKSRGSESLADLRARGVSAEEVRANLGFRSRMD